MCSMTLAYFQQLYPEHFTEDFTLEEYYWAYSVYASRNWYKSEKPLNPILPLIEAFSYREEVYRQ